MRFIPEDWTAALSFPFRMATLEHAVYSETFAPDVRFAMLLALGVSLPALARQRSAPGFGGADWRLFFFLAAGFLLWLVTSANGRYGLLLLLLAGVCLVRLVERALPRAAARITIMVLIILQVVTLVMTAPQRWYVAEPWSRRWIAYDAPPRAIREPALYLSIEPLPLAILAPFVHPESSFVNFRGQYSIPTGSAKLVALLERYRDRVRVVGRTLRPLNGRSLEQAARGYDATLVRIGYRVDPTDCFSIPWQSDSEDLLSRVANRWNSQKPLSDRLSVVSCALRPATRDPADIESERQFAALFDRIEKACAALLRGQTAVTESLGAGWSRNYAGLDMRLETDSDNVLLNRYGKGEYLYLGRVSDWQREEQPLPGICAR
jgi:hypothetical protein